MHCFDWTYAQIKEELPNIAAAGFSAVQTSPAHPREPIGAAWYMLYQPYDYKVGENGLGTKEGLTELCTEAHQYGVKIIVDVVANHTNGSLSYVASFWQDESLYHDYQGGIDYSNRWQVTHGRLGMWDLKTEDSRVQEKIKEYVAELKSCGVDGIRWDAAKHIGLPSEGDTFWQNVPDQTMYNYGEILDGTGGDDTVSEKVEVVSQTTGVQLHPVAGESSAKAMIYNLQGQRVDANYHGVVVCNGRKYVQ